MIGLSKTYYAANGESSGPSFLNFLYERGAVNSKVFAVHFDHFGGSTVEFGGYSPDKIVPNVPLTYLDLAYKPTWELRINAMRVGEKPTFPNGAKSAFYFPEKAAILDTFSPYISLPASLSSQLYSKIFHEVDEVHVENDLLLGPCDVSKYQSLNLFINDRYYVKLVPESFVVDIGVRGKCFVPFRFNDDDTFILGEPFFRNFYSVFDDTKGILGIGPSINFVHSSVFEGMVPNDELDYPHIVDKDDASKAAPQPRKPSGVIDAIVQKITSLLGIGGTQGGAPSKGKDLTSLVEIGVGVVAVLISMCCCCSVAVYLGLSYLQAPKKQAAGPRVKSSRSKASDENGVSLSKLLSAADIEDRLAAVRGQSSFSEDEEPVQKTTEVVSSRNAMNY